MSQASQLYLLVVIVILIDVALLVLVPVVSLPNALVPSTLVTLFAQVPSNPIHVNLPARSQRIKAQFLWPLPSSLAAMLL